MRKWKVEGRIRADITFEQEVVASTENSACNKAEKIMLKKLGITQYDILDNEYYVEHLKE